MWRSFIIALVFFIPNDAYAYINPDVGSMLYQVVIGSVLSGAVTLRLLRKPLIQILNKSQQKAKKALRL